MEPTDQDCQTGGKDQSIDAVHQSAVPGNNPARVLCAKAAFDPGLEQVPSLRSDGKANNHQQQYGADRR